MENNEALKLLEQKKKKFEQKKKELEQKKKELEIKVKNQRGRVDEYQEEWADVNQNSQNRPELKRIERLIDEAEEKKGKGMREIDRINREIKNLPFTQVAKGAKVAALNKFSKGKKTKDQRDFARDIKNIMDEDTDDDDDADAHAVADADAPPSFEEWNQDIETFEEPQKNSGDLLSYGGKRWPGRSHKRRRRKSRKKSKKRRKTRRSKKKRRKRRRTKKKRKRRR